MGTPIILNLNRDPLSDMLRSDPISTPGILIGTANFSDGQLIPTSIYPGTSWGCIAYGNGIVVVEDGALKMTYPPTTGGDGGLLTFGPPPGTSQIFISFKAKFSTTPHALKFCKAHGVDAGGDNRANCTFGLSGGGAMTQVSFGDGTSIGNDTQNVINLNGSSKESVGRSFSLGAVVLTPQNAPWNQADWGTTWHTFRLMVKFNSGTTALNEVPDGKFYVEIDGIIYVDAYGLFNRHYSNGPINYISFGDAAQDNDYGFSIHYDDVRFSLEGWA